MLLVANFANTKSCKKAKKMAETLALIWEYSVRAIQWIPRWHGLDGFQNFLYVSSMEESQEFIKGVIKGTVQIRQLGVEGLRGSPGGGGHSGTEGGRTRVTYFAEEGVFFKISTCPRFWKRRVLFLYPGTKYGGQNPLTIHETYAALTPSDSRSIWAFEFAAATCCR